MNRVFTRQIHPSYFTEGTFSSINNKIEDNLRILSCCRSLLRDIIRDKYIFEDNFFILRWIVQLLHAGYRLLRKVLIVFGEYSSHELHKSKYYELLHGPRHLEVNKAIFDTLALEVLNLAETLKWVVGVNISAKKQDIMTNLFIRFKRNLENFASEQMLMTNDFRNMKPIKLDIGKIF